MTPEQAMINAASIATMPIDTCALVQGGGNNRLFKLTSAGKSFALKWYPKQPSDPRDRLNTEFNALSLLANSGVFPCPAALGIDQETRLALYEWVDGERPKQIKDEFVLAAVNFVKDLLSLSTSDTAMDCGHASEACLSLGALIEQIERRLTRLEAVAKDYPALSHFLSASFTPSLINVRRNALAAYKDKHLNADQDIHRSQQTLSPSDFGFHNSILKPDGSLIFLDFEYFGWDDPVKLVADFLLHPGMDLSAAQQKKFFQRTHSFFSDDPEFNVRFRIQFPLFALRWAMILLNEFLPERLQRRRIAGMTMDTTQKQALQLEKARALTSQLNDKSFQFSVEDVSAEV